MHNPRDSVRAAVLLSRVLAELRRFDRRRLGLTNV
jgi:hypothetical protein